MSARPFTESEFSTLAAHFVATGQIRNLALLKVGCGTGYRITELLALRVGDVWDGRDVGREITIARRNLKGGRGAYHRSVRSRRTPLSEPVREALRLHLERIGTADSARALFSTAQAQGGAMDRSSVFRLLQEACLASGVSPVRVSTHSFRKTFAARIFQASGRDLVATQRIIGHSNPATTARYLETDTAQLDSLVRSIAA